MGALSFPLQMYRCTKFHNSGSYSSLDIELIQKTRQKFTPPPLPPFEKQYLCLASASQARHKNEYQVNVFKGSYLYKLLNVYCEIFGTSSYQGVHNLSKAKFPDFSLTKINFP